MRDWNRYVRERLPLRLRPEREAEIINELAQQLEQAYADFVRAGLPEEEAQARAEAQAGDWKALAHEINTAEAQPPQPEPPPPRLSLLGGCFTISATRSAFCATNRSSQ